MRGAAFSGHLLIYSRAHPLRIRDGVAPASGPQGLPVAHTPECSKTKRSGIIKQHMDATTTTTDYSQQPPQLPLEPQPHEHWQSLQAAAKEAISDHIPNTTSFPKHPWITQSTCQLIQQRSAVRLSQRFDLEAQLHRDIRKQTRKDKTQRLKERLAESEATLDPRQKWKWIKRVRSHYKPRPVSMRDSQGKPTSLSQRAQTFAEYLRGSTTSTIHRPHRTHTPCSGCGSHTHHQSRA